MIHSEEKFLTTEEEILTFFHGPGRPQTLSFNGSIASLRLVSESAASQYSAPTCLAADWSQVSAVTVLLKEMEADASLAVVRRETGDFLRIECSDSLTYLVNDDSLTTLKCFL